MLSYVFSMAKLTDIMGCAWVIRMKINLQAAGDESVPNCDQIKNSLT